MSPGEVHYPGAVPPARTRFVRSLGLHLHVCEWGDPGAEPVLLTHGFYDHARSFDLFAPLLAERYRVVAMDARGHGDSDRPDAYAWFPELIDVVNMLRDLGRAAHLVGHSRGGGQATDAATLHPEGVRKLVNMDGFGPPEEGFVIPGRERDEQTPPEQLGQWLDWRAANHSRETFRPCATLEELAERRRQQNPRLSAEWLRYFAARGSRHTPEGWVWKVDPMAARHVGPFRPEWIAPGWAQLRAPMLALVGSEPDTWGPLPEAMLARRLSHVPKVERGVVPDAGHFMHIEQPESVARIVLDWLEAG
jgi:pimeloyl-ACP methyl ester carboxylesterase